MTRRALFLLLILLGGLLLPACSGQAGLQFGLEGEGSLDGLLGGDESEQPSDQGGDGAGSSAEANSLPLIIILVLFILLLMVGSAMGRQKDL